jgi:hypothetical protein
VRTGEKIGARLRRISLNLSIGGISPFFTSGIICSGESEVKIIRIRLRVLIIENGKPAKISLPVGLTKCELSDSIFFTPLEKIDPHIGVLAGFRGFIWVIASSKNSIGCRAIRWHWARCKSALFW